MVAASTLGTRAGAYGTAGRIAAEARLADLRQKLREALAQKQLRMKEFVETCKADRRAVRDHVREMRDRSLRDLKDQIQAARGAAKLTRLTRLAEVRQVAGGPVQQARAAAAVEKAHQGELARLEREERSRRIEIRLAHDRSLAAGALRSAIFGKLAPLFERSVVPAPGESRAEAILRLAERNPEKAHAALEPGVHRKVEETKRAVAEAERTVRAAGGDVRVGTRPSPTEARDRRERQQRAAAQGAWPLPGQQRIGPVSPTSIGRTASDDGKGPSNDTTLGRARAAAAAMGSLGDVVREGASERVTASGAADGIADNVMATIARDAESGGKAPRKGAAPGKAKAAKPPKATAPKRPKPTKAPKPPKPVAATPSAPAERKKGQMPRGGGPGIALADLIQERDEIAAAKSAKTKGARDKRGPAKKVAAKKSSSAPAAPPAPGAGGSPAVSYAAWCELVSQAAGKHGRRIAFGGETHDAWRDGTSAEAFVLTQPTATQASPSAIVRDMRSGIAASGSARAPLAIVGGKAPDGSSSEGATKGPVVFMTIGDSMQPYKVRASCGHVVVRPMRASTAGVPYSSDVILEAPKGRACDACEAKQKPSAAVTPGPKPDFGAHAPNPAPKKDDVKAPELRDTAEIAKRIRADIAEAVRTKKLPKGTYSVRTSKYSMGSSIDVIASKLPFPLLNPAAFHLEKGSGDVSFNRDSFSTRYTAQAESVLATLNAIVGAYHWDRSDSMTDYYNERFGRDVKLDTSKEWERINEAKRAEARAASTPASTPVSTRSAPAVLPSPGRVEPPRSEKPETSKGNARARTGRPKAQQTLDTDSPLFAGAPRFVGAPAATAEGPTKSEEGGSEP
jgi:putative endonuclease